jgi:hypothetical protein
MPTFDTPEPIAVTVEFGMGALTITAGDRADTVVAVHPTDPASRSDVAAADRVAIEHLDGRLLIRAPKGWRQWTPWGGGESVSVHLDVPAGSDVTVDTGVAAVRCSGRLGECRIKTGAGEIRLDRGGPARLSTGLGDIIADRVTGDAELTTGSGVVRAGSVDGAAVIRNSNGDSRIGEVSGDLRVKAANGEITVERAGRSVVAKTANGEVRLGEVMRGAILAETACGGVEIGIRDGVAAWLDLSTGHGTVSNGMDAAQPEAGEDTVEVRARSSYGDIRIRRCPATPSVAPHPEPAST